MIIDSDDVCPVVLVQTLRAFRDAREGEEIVVKTKWEAAVQELKKWCDETGNTYIGWEKEGNKYVIKMKKGK
ncbi:MULTISPECIES: sulfurtransferase TusA family protein [Sulfolobaceae]|uniref:Sulfurtransferase TusA family protein n=1 Tax=Sulfurisphaera ohwakuensis TaxID=69656 RepID=A0A650CGS7_SULOH|nr:MULTISPECIES: sulfurtransferase TusA family protein [Sulfolobaceae]MBB5252458.1 TusA-related sulfurtransferase [Sulfurisphaera ohwakuensis]QGR17091.1 sulfurtransferase TusA family protein [Sulfurisphaera ohwakuensis]QIW24257.1 sulfurtransferase TusA family protein [Sulfolobus sp. S-194]